MTATIPRRHRKDNREARRNRDDEFDAIERHARVEVARRRQRAPRQRVPLREREMLPVARPIVTNPREELRWFKDFILNRIGHHGWRLDLRAWTFLCSFGRGVHRATVEARDWVQFRSGAEALRRFIEAGDHEKHAKHSGRFEERRKARLQVAGTVAGVGVLVLAVILLLAADSIGWPFTLSLFVPAVAGWFAFYGRRRGPADPAPTLEVDTRPVPKIDPRPTAEMIYAAFHHAGIDGIVCEIAPHRVGTGWETIVRIPIGTQTFKDAAKAHAKIAGNLGIGSECLVLAPIKGPGGSEKHARVWWTKQDPFAGDPPPHPFLDPRNGPVDLWNDGLPLGIDQRGTEIRIPIVDTPFVNVVGQPGSGKSFAFLNIITGIAADPLWDLDCWSFKPSDDFSPAKPLVEACGGTYRCGTDDATFKAFLDFLKDLRSTIEARNVALGRLPIDRRHRLKVERDVAADPTVVPRMRPRAIPADEIITALESKYGSAILRELEEGARTFRSQNVVFFLGSQFADSDIYKGLQKLLGGRICLSVARWQDSKGALGDRGHDPDIADASTIPLNAKAVAFVAGAMEDPVLGQRATAKFRFYGNDLRWVRDHINRCLAGCRAGQRPVALSKPTDGGAPLPVRVAAVFESGEEWLASAEIARRLGADWDARRVGRELRKASVPVEERSWRDAEGTHTVAGVWRRDLP